MADEPLLDVPEGKPRADRLIDIPSGADDAGQLVKLMDRPVHGVTALTPWPGSLTPPGPAAVRNYVDVPAEP
jgi:hypothetical protein